MDLEYPKNDTLFVDKDIYDFSRWEALSKTSFYVGEYEIGENATLNALKARIPYLYNNLVCYREAKKRSLENKSKEC